MEEVRAAKSFLMLNLIIMIVLIGFVIMGEIRRAIRVNDTIKRMGSVDHTRSSLSPIREKMIHRRRKRMMMMAKMKIRCCGARKVLVSV